MRYFKKITGKSNKSFSLIVVLYLKGEVIQYKSNQDTIKNKNTILFVQYKIYILTNVGYLYEI